MALVTRYFSTTSAGAGDGTTWADRAALFSAGLWSDVIKNFNFTGGDSLLCMVEGSLTYSCGQYLTGAVFTSGAPANGAQLVFTACDSSGAEKPMPNPGWVSARPVWDATGMPVIATTTDIFTTGVGIYRGIKFTSSGRIGGAVVTSITGYSCLVEQNAGTYNTTLAGVHNCALHNSAVVMTGANYYAISSSGLSAWNTRLQSSATSTGGQRRASEGTGPLIGCTVMGKDIEAILGYNGHGIFNCVVVGGKGILLNTSGVTPIRDCVIAGSSTYGIVQSGTGVSVVQRCRLRNNTSGVSNTTNSGELVFLDSDTSAGTDADEFVDAANGDYRIKYGSALWGKGIGAGDGPATIVA